jgi:hypothetical protein
MKTNSRGNFGIVRSLLTHNGAAAAARAAKLLSIQQLRPLARFARKRGGAVLGRYSMMVQ